MGVGTTYYSHNQWDLVYLRFFRTLDVRPKWRMVYAIAHFDLFSFYGAVFLWRETNENLWVAFILGSLMVITAIISHRYRRVVFRELLAPQSGCGKLLAIVGVVGGGIAGVIGFTLGRIFNITTLGHVVFPLCLLLMVIAHSFWAKAEDPTGSRVWSRLRKNCDWQAVRRLLCLIAQCWWAVRSRRTLPGLSGRYSEYNTSR